MKVQAQIRRQVVGDPAEAGAGREVGHELAVRDIDQEIDGRGMIALPGLVSQYRHHKLLVGGGAGGDAAPAAGETIGLKKNGRNTGQNAAKAMGQPGRMRVGDQVADRVKPFGQHRALNDGLGQSAIKAG